MSITLKNEGNNNNGYGGSYNGGYNGGNSINYGRNNNYSSNTRVDDSYYKPSKRGGLNRDTILNIAHYSELAIYGMLGLSILSIIIMAGIVSSTFMLLFIKALGTITFFLNLADSIFNVVYMKKSVALIIVAVILNGIYPLARNWIIDGSPDKIAILLTVGYWLSLIFFAASIL